MLVIPIPSGFYFFKPSVLTSAVTNHPQILCLWQHHLLFLMSLDQLGGPAHFGWERSCIDCWLVGPLGWSRMPLAFFHVSLIHSQASPWHVLMVVDRQERKWRCPGIFSSFCFHLFAIFSFKWPCLEVSVGSTGEGHGYTQHGTLGMLSAIHHSHHVFQKYFPKQRLFPLWEACWFSC